MGKQNGYCLKINHFSFVWTKWCRVKKYSNLLFCRHVVTVRVKLKFQFKNEQLQENENNVKLR